MSPRLKKSVVLALKIVILVGLLEYARRQSQLDDEIAVPEGGVALHDEFVGPGVRLKVVDVRKAADGAPLAYEVATPGGKVAEIPASDERFSLLPGLVSLFHGLDWRYLGLAFAAFGPPIFLMAVRWQLLLLASGVEVPFFILVRLHYMAFFFNTFMPGGAGGDIIKAVYVTKHSEQKAEAATMVLIDRVVGLLGLLAMAGTVVLFDYRELHGIAAEVGTISLALIGLFGLYFSAWFRRLVRFDAILERLPRSEVLKKIDASLFALRAKKRQVLVAFALTVAFQLLEVVGVWLAGRSLGLHKATFVHYVAFVPIGYLFNALPISFGGIGLMEGAYLKLFRDAGVATATQGFMLGVLARLIVVGWSMVGALSALFPPKQAEALPDEGRL
jgi:glycosyltransferase 2 family protein